MSREPKKKGRTLLQILISRAVHRESLTIDQARLGERFEKTGYGARVYRGCWRRLRVVGHRSVCAATGDAHEASRRKRHQTNEPQRPLTLVCGMRCSGGGTPPSVRITRYFAPFFRCCRTS
jgi:hypothetical protein